MRRQPLALVLTIVFLPLTAPAATAPNIVTVRFHSAALNEDRPVNILLPDGYATSTRRYPVLYLLHGYGHDYTSWATMTNMTGYARDRNIIIVMPEASKSFYVNYAHNPKLAFEDYLIKDLMKMIDTSYRTIPQPRARAIAGLSMGGFGAVYLGLKYYKQFSYIASFSGAIGYAHGVPSTDHENSRRIDAEALEKFGPMNSPERQARDPFLLLEKVPLAEMPRPYIACGGEDFLVNDNREFVKLLASKNIPYEYREISPRVHTWDFWDDQLRAFLEILSVQKIWSTE